MFSNPYREILVDSLSSILNPEFKIKSSTLLQAFATFKTIIEVDSANFSSAYKKIFGEEPESSFHSRLSHKNLISYSNAFLDPTINLFASLSPDEFFRYIIPDIVSNPTKTAKMLHQKFSDNILLFAHHIIQINFVVRNDNISIIENQEDVLKRLYHVYTKTETHSETRLKQSIFLELYNAIYLHPLDYEELTLRTIDSETKKIHSAIDILANQLEIPRKEQVDILYRYYVRDEQPNELIKNHKIYNFIKNKDILERKKLMRAAILNLAQAPPLEALCVVSIIKKFNKKHPLQNTYIPNDITLENGLIYTLFTSYSVFSRGKEKDIFVFFPSPFFIRKWLADPDAKQKNTTFIMKDACVNFQCF